MMNENAPLQKGIYNFSWRGVDENMINLIVKDIRENPLEFPLTKGDKLFKKYEEK